MDLSIHIEPPIDSNQRVALGGRLDTNSHAELDRQLAPILESTVRSLVLDLAHLDYISSAGIRSILRARKALAARHGKLLVVNPQPQIQKVFDLSRRCRWARSSHRRRKPMPTSTRCSARSCAATTRTTTATDGYPPSPTPVRRLVDGIACMRSADRAQGVARFDPVVLG